MSLRPDRNMLDEGEDGLLSSSDVTSPHLSRMAWIAEQIAEYAGLLPGLLHQEAFLRDATEEQVRALAAAHSLIRTGYMDIKLLASAMHVAKAREVAP